VRRGINVPLCYTRAMSLYAVKCLTVPEMPNNEGATAPVSLTAPEGSILNAQPPSPTGGRHIIGHYVVPLIFGTLAEALPGRVQADCGMMNLITFQGRHRNGRPISTIYFAAGGFGALEGRDGAETTPGPSNMRVVPVEVWEALTSTTILEKRLLPDSGGPGAARGGLGQEVLFRNDTAEPITLFGMGTRSEFPARGFLGGGQGSPRRTLVNGQVVHPKGTHVLKPGDTLTMREAGGGGFGDPKTRPRAKLDADLAQGFVSEDAARQLYGL
jgi:N-methylhydantoinase B